MDSVTSCHSKIIFPRRTFKTKPCATTSSLGSANLSTRIGIRPTPVSCHGCLVTAVRSHTLSHGTSKSLLRFPAGDAIEPGSIPRRDGMSIERFSALTALQYERFRNWKDGKFTLGTPFGTKMSIEEYDLQEQPAVLTRAALEQTIGDPLYPGIEAFWMVKLSDTFDTGVKGLHPPFRVRHDKVLPGFLSRGLSLPWQSDFDLCNTHW